MSNLRRNISIASAAMAMVTIGGTKLDVNDVYADSTTSLNSNVNLNSRMGTSDVATGITTANLNLRSGAGTQYSIKCTLPKGSKLTITPTTNINWVKVLDVSGKSNVTGYVSRQYIIVKDLEEDNTSVKNEGTYKVNTGKSGSSLILRNDYFSQIGKLPTGTTFDILDNDAQFSEGNWFKKIIVRTCSDKKMIGQQGFVAIKYTNAPQNITAPQFDSGKFATTSKVYLMDESGKSVLGVLNKGDRFDVFTSSGTIQIGGTSYVNVRVKYTQNTKLMGVTGLIPLENTDIPSSVISAPKPLTRTIERDLVVFSVDAKLSTDSVILDKGSEIEVTSKKDSNDRTVILSGGCEFAVESYML